MVFGGGGGVLCYFISFVYENFFDFYMFLVEDFEWSGGLFFCG